jgi:N-acetylneuraminate synthase/N,N'-diacetyllegionaminate synthase
VGNALRLIDAAADSGADCVKFQTFAAERVAGRSAPKASYQLRNTDEGESQLEMLRKLELPLSCYDALLNRCRQRGIEFLSTPYNHEDVDFLDSKNVAGFKLASIHAAEPAFVNYVARKNRPIILSTGMATLAEVDRAVTACRDAGNDQLVVLQCTTDYPSDVADANLRAMQTMQAAFGVAVGYSDHTDSSVCAIVSVALGGCVIEKHLTLDRHMSGPDHSSSLETEGFRNYVGLVRQAEASLGAGRKIPSASELRNRPNMRRSIVARRRIAGGSRIAIEDLTFQRPMSGLPPQSIDMIVGTVAKWDIDEGTVISLTMCGEP